MVRSPDHTLTSSPIIDLAFRLWQPSANNLLQEDHVLLWATGSAFTLRTFKGGRASLHEFEQRFGVGYTGPDLSSMTRTMLHGIEPLSQEGSSARFATCSSPPG
jgi:hypothetical protein